MTCEVLTEKQCATFILFSNLFWNFILELETFLLEMNRNKNKSVTLCCLV
jgi:hypothetical protein